MKFWDKILKRKSRRKLEEELENKQKEVNSLNCELQKKDEKIKNLKIEIQSLMDNKHQFFVARTITAYVLDACFCECNNFKQEFKKIIDSEKKIILTDITIRELKKIIIESPNKSHIHAKNILDCALLYKQKFICVNIDWEDNADNSIIKFCAEHKSKVELLTCDKEMALLAETEDVKVQYLKVAYNKTIALGEIIDLNENGYINHFEYINKSIMVRNHNNGENVFSGEYILTPGDEIFIICDKHYNYEFEHYRVPSKEKNKAVLVYSTVIWNEEETINLERKDYTHFIRNYLSKKTQEGS